MSGLLKGLLTLFFFIQPAISLAEDLYDMAVKEYRAGRYENARLILGQKQNKDSGDYNLLGWINLRLGDLPSAEDDFKASIGLNPARSDSYCGLGYVFYRKGETQNAIRYFEEGLKMDPQNRDCLDGRLIISGTAEKQERKIEFFAKGDYFWIKENVTPVPLFIKGVNIGFGLPGRFPTEFPEDESLYEAWLDLISDMNANVIRAYTILPPEFYRALKKHNSRGKRLYLFQGIWVELPERADFRAANYLNEVKQEIRNAVDVIHDNANITHRYGHAYGRYTEDISNYVIGFIFGREWEPYEVIKFNSLNPVQDFKGKYLSIQNGNAFEVWLTEMLNYLIDYEIERYHTQRPVAFMNWPTLDPLFHLSESTLAEEIEIRKRLGEKISLFDFDFSRAFDDDAVGLDEEKIIQEISFKAGVFASYHVYPYYPDFMKNDEGYSHPYLQDGSTYYYNYLRELKAHLKEIPLLVSEFGLPTSRGIARFHPEGLNHGGLSEEEQAEGLRKLFFSIQKSGAAGGMVFSWIDEWWKKNWSTGKYEENDPLWYNPEDPEENYGLIAILPSKVEKRLKGLSSEPDEYQRLYCPEDPLIGCILADSDEGYIYIRMDLKKKPNWAEDTILLAIDTYGDKEGDHLLPSGLGIRSPIGFEFIVLFSGAQKELLVDNYYAKFIFDPEIARLPGLTGYKENNTVKPLYNEDGIFVDIVIPHRRRFSRDGRIFEEKLYNASQLKEKRDFYYSEKENIIELKIPWSLLNFSDPSKKRILYGDKEYKLTDGIRILALSCKTGSKDASSLKINSGSDVIEKNILLMQQNPYRWNDWNKPSYIQRPKKAYYVMREIFKKTDVPSPRLNIPDGFDFTYAINKHYNSIDDFINLYAQKIDERASYGAAIANLIMGLVTKNIFYIHEAKRIFLHVLNSENEQKTKTLSELAIGYINRLIVGGENNSLGEYIHVGHGGILTNSPVNPLYRSGTVPFATHPAQRVIVDKNRIKEGKFQKLIIGKTSIKLNKNSVIKTQVDRVTRDWLSGYNISNGPYELNDIVPWHEGLLIQEILKNTDLKIYPVWGTVVKKFQGIWYAPDEKGIFRFPVSEDKVYNYPSNIIVDPATVIINDTHGINTIAWDSVNADLVIGCGDHEGKVEAAYYLASKGVNVYMPTDRFLSLLIGTKTAGTIIGSAPIKKTEEGVIIGDQPVVIELTEPIVVSYSSRGYPLQYYDTPYRYFRALEEYLGTELHILPVEVGAIGGAVEVVKKARQISAKLIGIRVQSRDEHDTVYKWLEEDKTRRAVLFHSAVYPEGYRLFFEFPEQVTFGDIYVYPE